MPRQSWDNLDVFLQTPDFAVTATITLQTAEVRSVVGIYDDPYLNAELGEYDADLSQPRFTCKLADATGIKRGDEVAIPGEPGTFSVMSDPQGDGTGMCVLRLTHDIGP